MAIYERPASTFVAGFIGSPAMKSGAGHGWPEGGVVLPGGTVLALPGLALPAVGSALRFGVRPEHLQAQSPDSGAPEAQASESGMPEAPALTLEVFAVETLGADAYAHCLFPGGSDHPDEGFVVRLPGNTAARQGDRIRVSLDLSALHLFDDTSGRRIGEAV